MGRVAGSILLVCLIRFTNGANTIPEIENIIEELREDIPIGGHAFNILARDAENDTLVYALTGPSASFFNVNKTTGEVTVKMQLDREVAKDLTIVLEDANDNPPRFQSATYDAEVREDSGGQYNGEWVVQSSNTWAFINVVDIPDLDPEFLSLPYTTRVEEGSRTALSVFQVTAIDRDTGVNDVVIYSIENSTFPDLFSISPNDGVISIKSDIDREVTGDVVTLTVKATESRPNIHGIHASTTADVTITIIDINDNKPEFYMCGGTEEVPSCVKESNFTGEIVEHSLGTVPINMTVKDIDKGAKIKLTLEGADKDVFSVAPSSTISESTVQLVVKSQKLDFEEKERVVVKVIAIDQENHDFRSTATVTIEIKDINDNRPIFPHDSYKLQVPEHSLAGTVVANITAEDLDKVDIDKITYRLLPERILNYFDVGLNNGAVYVKNSTAIDREVTSLYSATLEAKDSYNNTGTTVLEITLTDINDKAPVINRDSYKEYVEEGKPIEIQIQATDADDPDTPNGQIVFGIMPSRYSDNFTIDPNTGMLRNNGELDLEALDPSLEGEIKLNVTATDKGTPTRSAMVTVIINVEDINDNAPEFKEASYKFSVKEGEKGAFVGSVQAEDRDQTKNFNRISFSFINGSIGSFIIRTYAEVGGGYRGNITVDPDVELDYESVRKNFTMLVEAADLEQEKAFVIVEVEVLDVNDERPEFKPADPLRVKENTTIAGAVGKFTAEDRDGNHSLVYELESITCLSNDTLEVSNWFILEPTGEITVNPENTVDYEYCKQVLMKAQVVDKYTEKGENNSVTPGEMVINIEDINDNAPEFIVSVSDTVFVVVSETASTGTSVATIAAVDADTDTKNKHIDFKVIGVQFCDTDGEITPERKIFEAVPKQQNELYEGIIQCSDKLDSGLKGKYLLNVSASNNGDLSTYTELEGTVAVEDPEQDPLIFILAGLVGGLIIVLAVLTTSLMCSRRSYRTKLKAAKAMSSAAMVATDNQKSGPVVPGTNKYTMEGANPVLNLNIDTTTDLGFDEESSNADKLSVNSLDYDIDMTMPERDMMSMMIIQEEDEDSGAPEHIEPLGAALAQRGMKKKGSKAYPAFSNPAFSTTDL
ncbi:cadherin-related family member 2 [Diretmus argenteus]